jgi:predicted nucleic acid-binding Zn ribbon protein
LKPQKKRETTFLTGRASKIPVYDFKCECGKTSTITVGLKEVDGFRCTCICGKVMQRVFGVGAVTFKGTGWGGSR